MATEKQAVFHRVPAWPCKKNLFQCLIEKSPDYHSSLYELCISQKIPNYARFFASEPKKFCFDKMSNHGKRT